jgi:hypothetical protein
MLRLDFSKNEDGHQFEHTIEHLRSVELNLLLHLILQGFYSISHTSTHIKPHISRVLIKLVKQQRDLEITMGAAEVVGHGNKGGAGGIHLLQKRGGHCLLRYSVEHVEGATRWGFMVVAAIPRPGLKII